MKISSFLAAVCLLCFAGTCGDASAKVKLPAIFSDGMVMQQLGTVPVWGESDRKQGQVTVKTSWNGEEYTAAIGSDGKWKAMVETPRYGGPYSIYISDGETVTINNVLIGEVWVCSGQSNMNMTIDGSYNDPVIGALDAVVTSTDDNIRMFTVGQKMDSKPLAECTGEWKAASSENTPHFTAAGYYFARKIRQVLGVPVGIIHTAYGGSRVEAWMSAEGVAPFKDIEEVQNECILYNGMLAPVVGYGIRGCLWYQGEANVDYPDLYTRLLPAMVADWREKWGQGEFPFYYAQIAPYNYGRGEGKGNNSAYLREAQTKCLDLIPNSGMAILTDVGYPNTIHPMKKEEVGDRFAYLALGLTYGMKGFPVTGPMFQEMKIEGKEATVTFKSTGRGVTSYRQDIRGFEIAGADRVFHPAKARISNDPKKVIVWSDEVAQPVAVRFCFKDYTDCNLFNYAGLPASSFRTDNWDDK